MGFDIFINKFLEAGDMNKQIVVLGAGSDTKYFNLKVNKKIFITIIYIYIIK